MKKKTTKVNMDKLTRSEVAEQLKLITNSVKDHNQVKELVAEWLEENDCPTFMKQQVLNDLTSYPEYLQLVN